MPSLDILNFMGVATGLRTTVCSHLFCPVPLNVGTYLPEYNVWHPAHQTQHSPQWQLQIACILEYTWSCQHRQTMSTSNADSVPYRAIPCHATVQCTMAVAQLATCCISTTKSHYSSQLIVPAKLKPMSLGNKDWTTLILTMTVSICTLTWLM